MHLERTDNALAVCLRGAGRLRATVRDRRTGKHVALRFQAKRRPENGGRWPTVPLAQATHLFADVPTPDEGWADDVGTLRLERGDWYPHRGADPERVRAARRVLDLAGLLPAPPDPDLEVLAGERCYLCNAELTDPVSIERGLGPRCAEAATGSVHQTKLPPGGAGGRPSPPDRPGAPGSERARPVPPAEDDGLLTLLPGQNPEELLQEEERC